MFAGEQSIANVLFYMGDQNLLTASKIKDEILAIKFMTLIFVTLHQIRAFSYDILTYSIFSMV